MPCKADRLFYWGEQVNANSGGFFLNLRYSFLLSSFYGMVK